MAAMEVKFELELSRTGIMDKEAQGGGVKSISWRRRQPSTETRRLPLSEPEKGAEVEIELN
ncbi:hypothetical protein E2562_024987 [Oryza meyeriana var. granulata]|uniref:Uncharacterized protein n=1 Tax=Oryza meyeriana var. granulata TaxID=110450 RepID=A0A6G1FBN8_9ORYZ|nr:hypothetical protein E2562_024987 [Oryza meyeriana var. granulata]